MGEEESWQTAAKAEVHWDDVCINGEELEGELEMIVGEGNVELPVDGTLGLYYGMIRNVTLLIDKYVMHLSE